jgi:AraC family transcriptional regulator of adaptative response / DNA-3-methyladenine glycosylase II
VDFERIGYHPAQPRGAPESDSIPDGMAQETRMLDSAECDRARLARDPAYDGRFFTGVRTTGIYCRPVCPVRPARSAASAYAAGFRPCLRCRPETAPFSPAWNGSKTTVARALRLIAGTAGDEAASSAAALAERLGIGPRHLLRLFRKHVGATPSQVARTARVQRAKRLLDETDLEMTEIALEAGFGSVRRFNAGFCEIYKRPPSAIRRSARATR